MMHLVPIPPKLSSKGKSSTCFPCPIMRFMSTPLMVALRSVLRSQIRSVLYISSHFPRGAGTIRASTHSSSKRKAQQKRKRKGDVRGPREFGQTLLAQEAFQAASASGSNNLHQAIEAQPNTPLASRGAPRCGTCGGAGHNSRTCRKAHQ